MGNIYFKSEKDNILECEYCEQHYCIKCLKYKVGEYEAMQKPVFLHEMQAKGGKKTY